MDKVASSNNDNKIDLSLSVEQHHKHNQSNKDKQVNEVQTHQD